MKRYATILPAGFGRNLARAAVLLLVAAILSTTSRASAELVDRIVALVNDDIILLSDLEKAMEPWRAKLSEEGYSEAQQRILLADQRSMMLEQLINEKLTDQQIEKYQIDVDDAQVTATIERIKAVNNLDDKKLMTMLEMDGLTYEQYRREIKEQLLRQQLVNRQVKSKIVITEDDVKGYYEKHKETYAGKIKYHLRHILMKVPQTASEADRAKVFQLMQQVRERSQAGEDFAKLAEVYSEAPSARKGGDLGLFEAKLLAQPVREALEGLERGQTTPIIDTEFGYQVFLVKDIVHTGGKSFDEAKPEIEDKLFNDIVDQRFKEWLKQLRQSAHIEVMD